MTRGASRHHSAKFKAVLVRCYYLHCSSDGCRNKSTTPLVNENSLTNEKETKKEFTADTVVPAVFIANGHIHVRYCLRLSVFLFNYDIYFGGEN